MRDFPLKLTLLGHHKPNKKKGGLCRISFDAILTYSQLCHHILRNYILHMLFKENLIQEEEEGDSFSE
jgi:hypothetical protein